VRMRGLRGQEHSTLRLAPVTVWVGPNGSGKSSAVGAIAFALTGRYPGVMGVHPADLDVVATSAAAGFEVEVTAEGAAGEAVSITRGVDREHVGFLKVAQGDRWSRGTQSAQAMLAGMVGEVGWFVDAFDPERSVWRLSMEKRKEWMLGICAGASGWTKARLKEIIGPADDDWDPTVSSDPALCLDMNLDRLKQRLLAAQRVVREAKTIAEGVSVDPAAESRLATVEPAYEAARRVVLDKERLLEQAEQRNVALEKLARDRAHLGEQVARARQAVSERVPPVPPVAVDLALLDQREGDLVALQLELDDAVVAQADTERAVAVARESCRRSAEELEAVLKGGSCRFCETASPSHVPFRRRVQEAQVALDALLAKPNGLAVASALRAREALLREEIGHLQLAAKVHAHDQASFLQRQAEFERTWQTALTAVSALDAQIASLPAAALAVPTDALFADLDAARARETKLKTELNSLRASVGVALERRGQLQAAKDAATRVAVLKEKLDRMRRVRDQMLDDAVDPLRAALTDLRDLAPGEAWEIRRSDRDLDIGLVRGSSFLPATSLSTGEKYRATVALLIARSMVRREPWTGLFLDGFEAIYPAEERDVVIVAVSRAVAAGFVDNVFVAGACSAPAPASVSPLVMVYQTGGVG
jgi:DNA repair exonuclease SbcCD ATPase subunit